MALAPSAEGDNVVPVNVTKGTTNFPKARPSASADASRAEANARLRAMTVEERVRMALSLGRTLSGLKPCDRGG